MGKRRAVLALLLFFSFSLSIVTSGIVFASSGNWSEVTRFTGGSDLTTTETFTCDHVEWRIRWEIEPSYGFLAVYGYPDEFHSAWFESIVKNPITNVTSGTLYIHDKNGTFYLEILASLESYTLIIEQDVESIPEFPSWIILPLTMMATLIGLAVKRRRL